MSVSERSLSYSQAREEGLALPKIVVPNDSFSALSAQYWKTLGEGNMSAGQRVISENQIKPEAFWRTTFDSFTSKWIPNAKTTTRNIQEQTRAIQERTGREVSAKQATTRRAARAVSGMLSSAQSPAMGASSSGPMLGQDSMLSEESMLGSRRKV